LLASVAGIALVAGAPANAADLGQRPTYKAPPVVAPVPLFTWTGCYLGGHIGGGWGFKDFADPARGDGSLTNDFIGDGSAPQSIRARVSGFLGGGQVGCDFQFATNWVAGIEASFSGANIKGNVLDPFRSGKVFTARTDWLTSVTDRIGWAWDRWLIYAKGGVAWVGDKYHVVDGNNTPSLYDASEDRLGWTAGIGIEWAFWNNWSAKLEYDFYDFGRRTVLIPRTNNAESFDIFAVLIKQEINTVKFGINYRFGWGKAPVVARY
jgi:outer membrane immunogenic protein